MPLTLVENGQSYLQGMEGAQAREAEARAPCWPAERACRPGPSSWPPRTNACARLLDLQPALQVKTVAAEVLYEAADPYSRKVFIDRGARQGLAPARR